jgi:hypothetical protein
VHAATKNRISNGFEPQFYLCSPKRYPVRDQPAVVVYAVILFTPLRHVDFISMIASVDVLFSGRSRACAL